LSSSSSTSPLAVIVVIIAALTFPSLPLLLLLLLLLPPVGNISPKIGWQPLQVAKSRSLRGKRHKPSPPPPPKAPTDVPIPVLVMNSTLQKVIPGYKSTQCTVLERLGIDQRFWWVS